MTEAEVATLIHEWCERYLDEEGDEPPEPDAADDAWLAWTDRMLAFVRRQDVHAFLLLRFPGSTRAQRRTIAAHLAGGASVNVTTSTGDSLLLVADDLEEVLAG